MEEAAYKGEDEEQEKEFVLKDILSVRNYTQLHGDLLLLRLEMKSGDEALRAEISSLRNEMQIEFKAVRSEIKQGDDALRAEINELRTEMQGEFKAVRGEINTLGARLDGKIDALAAKLSGDTDMLAIAINKIETRLDDFQKAQSNHIALVAAVCSVISAVIAILTQYFMH